MQWLLDLFVNKASVAANILLLMVVAGLGLGVGTIKIRGLSLGIAGVLFSGLAFGHFGLTPNGEILHFASEFGLILFVYAVGLQVGPGFLSAMKAQGLRLNACAASIVFGGVLLTILIHVFGGVSLPVAAGLFSGATTNTPSLGSATQTLQSRPPPIEEALAAYKESNPPRAAELSSKPSLTDKEKEEVYAEVNKLPGLGYAVAYPFGVLGIIVVMLLVRAFLGIDVVRESELLQLLQRRRSPELSHMNVLVTNPNLNGVAITNIPALGHLKIVISRILHQGALKVAEPGTLLEIGDTILAVGKPESLEEFRLIVGSKADQDLKTMPSSISARRIVVTKRQVIGKSLDELDFMNEFGVQVTRVRRAEVEFPPTADLRLQYADRLLVVGADGDIDKVAAAVGNSPRQLDHPEVVSLCFGIALGIILGSYPIFLPGVPEPVRLGLAGGPLLVAIVISRIGKVGPFVSHVPMSANFMLRELGIVLFLACIGLRSGDRFIETLVRGDGLWWMGLAALITFVPLFVCALVMRLVLKENFLTMTGTLAGSMTDPPALAFANSMSQTEGPSVAYATVYPLTMILRIICAQLMILFL